MKILLRNPTSFRKLGDKQGMFAPFGVHQRPGEHPTPHQQ